MNHIIFELGLAVALIAVMGLLSAKFRLSIIPFYIIIGMLVGPHAPHLGIMDFRFIGSTATIVFLGQLGVIFLLFYLGLEFSLGQLMKAGKAIVTGGTIYIAINLAVGLLFGFFAGFPFKELILVAGITTISSSAITAKILVDLKRTANSETEMILGITMFEDIFLAVYISILSGLILGGGSSGAAIALSGSIALGYMLLLLLAGRKFVPFLNRALNIKSNEVFQLVIFSILFLVAGFSETIHVAESIGALLVGLILAETEHVKRIEHMILPYRDFFGAMFFFSFGLTIDPMSLGGTVGLSVAAVLVTGGTGVAPRDVTPESVAPLLERVVPGFGELFRALSYQEIGSAALLSRALAGISRGKVVFVLPGSTGAVRLAMEKLVLPELGHLAAEAVKTR